MTSTIQVDVSQLTVAIAAAIFVKIALDDFRRRFISNRWLLILLGSFVLLASTAPDLGQPIWWAHLAWGVLGATVFGLMYTVGGMAAGDVKLAGVVFLWTPPSHWVGLLIVIALAGVAVIPIQQWQNRRDKRAERSIKAEVPYGVALAAGGLWACAGWWIRL